MVEVLNGRKIMAKSEIKVRNEVTGKAGSRYRVEEGGEASGVNKSVTQIARVMEGREGTWLLNVTHSEFAF